MNANSQVGFDFWIIVVVLVAIIVASVVIVFIAGYLTGSARTKRMMENLAWMKKDRQQRKIIRMQAAPKPKKTSNYASGYYPSAWARRNQAKYRRAMKRQTRMRGK